MRCPAKLFALYRRCHSFRAASLLFALSCFATPASFAQHLDSHPTKWSVLVLDRVARETGTSDAQWSTIWCDSDHFKILDGIVCATTDTLYRFTVKNTKDSASCPHNAFPFSYKVEQLMAEPLDGSTAKIWLGQGALALARSAMHMHLASCHEFESRKKNLSASESYEHTHLRVLSIYGRYAGIEEIIESMGFGQNKAIVLFDRGPHTILSYGLSRNDKRLLLHSEMESARAEFLKMDGFRDKTIKLTQLTNYVLIPAGGGAAAEFAIPENEQSPDVVRTVCIPIKRDLLSWYDRLRHSFVKEHPALLDWNKLSFYTIAPDGSAVAFARDGQLYWQMVGSQARPIAPLHEVRGWQWHNERYLKPAERKALAID